jgi:multisubunit Na+/H+ antiporter MnhC subunit
MKYLIAGIFTSIAISLTLTVGFGVYLAITEAWQYWLVSLGILGPAVVAVLISSAAFTVAKDY